MKIQNLLFVLAIAALLITAISIAFRPVPGDEDIVLQPTPTKTAVGRIRLEPMVTNVRVTRTPVVAPTRTPEWVPIPTLINYTPQPCVSNCRPTIYGNP